MQKLTAEYKDILANIMIELGVVSISVKEGSSIVATKAKSAGCLTVSFGDAVVTTTKEKLARVRKDVEIYYHIIDDTITYFKQQAKTDGGYDEASKTDPLHVDDVAGIYSRGV